MNYSFIKNKKAASISAAFLFSTLLQAATISSYENIKNKTAELLALRQKDKAIQLIINYSKAERSRAYREEVSELLYNVGQVFMTKEAQEDYETSLNETLKDEKKSLRLVESCLRVEPQNLDCLIQKARLYHRLNNKKNFTMALEEINSQLVNSKYAQLFHLMRDKTSSDFKNKQFIGILPIQPNERTFFYLILEIERAFKVKNYSRVREVINYCAKHYPNWPDLFFLKSRLNAESSENQIKTDEDLLNVYVNKCKNISQSISRKFRYDFDLCIRGKKYE
jgi:hypothetical protein